MLDLRGWSLEKDGPVRLDGEWEFCWDRLIGPADFAKMANREGCGFIQVPSPWNRHEFGGARLPGKGRATYRLKILFGPDNREKSLCIHRIFSAYRLWINGTLADTRGRVMGDPTARKDYIFIHNKKYSPFTPVTGTNEIIIQVFNREYKSGGIDRPLLLEDEKTGARGRLTWMAVNMFIAGILFFVAVYNILFYFFRREDTASLYLGLLSLVLSVNTYNIQFPILPGGLSYPPNPYLINYLTVTIGGPLCMMTIWSLYPDDYSFRIAKSSIALTAAFVIPHFFVGFNTAEKIMNAYSIVIIIYIIYCVYVFIRTIINKRDDAILFVIGFAAVFAATVNNILYMMWIIDTFNTVQFGMAILCVTTTMVISRRFSRALRTVKNLSTNLEAKNIELRKMDQIKDQFLASTSHELRTPLHGMIGLSESMIEGAAGSLPPKAIENLSLISSSGQRLANMVNDLLDMAKIQDEGLALNLRPVDLHALCEMVVKLSLPLAGGKPLEIINRIGPEIPPARADEDRVRQVLCNLVGNAIKFTNRGTIEITARVIGREDENRGDDSGGMIEVRVSDTGIGVPEEYREAIFEAYRQVDEGDTRAYPGTGLGLAIAKNIVELHGGTIRVESGSGGSVFTFTLPVSNNPEPVAREAIIIEGLDDGPPPEETGEGGPPAGTGEVDFVNNPVLLVVDDDPVNIRILQNYLESKRCVVKTAADGISALDIINRDGSIDLVLLDLMMPVMSGYDVCRRIRMERTPEELPVIMITAKNMMADIDTAFEAGANDYIVKPVRMRELLARVGTMLQLRNIRKSASEGITIRDRNITYPLKFNDIIHIASHSKNSVLHTGERAIEVPVLMKDIIDRLPPDLFVRIHKSHIVNLQYIRSLVHVLSGRYRVRLRDEDDTELPVGPAFLEGLRKKL